MKYGGGRLLEKFYIWLAWKLPPILVTWAFSRVVAHATQGEYSSQILPELTAMDAINRWTYDHNI